MSIEKINVNYIETPLVQEARRMMELCNACRYCEGFCAVFPAMEQRKVFEQQDLNYLANLCHNCTACYHSCQYAPPHDFKINLPKAFSELRHQSYQQFAWPAPLAILFHKNGLLVSTVVVVSLILIMALGAIFINSDNLTAIHIGSGAFYNIVSHEMIVLIAGSTFCYSLIALTAGLFNFWKDGGHKLRLMLKPEPLIKALKDVASLRYLGGGHGEGCNTKDSSYSNQRRIFHHFMMWGFLLCFLATCVATLYEYGFNIIAPFPFYSLPVLLGTVGGIGLLIGPAGLIWIKQQSDPKPVSKSLNGMDYSFLILLFFISFTGLALLGFRETSAMGLLLIIHLGFVFALFVILPYSKFVHSIYRFAALVRFHLETPDEHSFNKKS